MAVQRLPRPLKNDPARKRSIALMVLAIALIALTVAIKMPNGGSGFTLQSVLGFGGLTTMPFALGAALVYEIGARRLARMRRGEGIIARWTIGPAQWQAFVARSRQLDRGETWAPNSLDLRTSPSAAVEVIVSDNAVLVGDEFHTVEKDATVVVDRAFIEFRHLISDPNGSDGRTLLRIPVAEGAQVDAERVRRQYNAVYAAAAANPRAKLYIALGFAIFVLVFVIWGVLSEMGGRH